MANFPNVVNSRFAEYRADKIWANVKNVDLTRKGILPRLQIFKTLKRIEALFREAAKVTHEPEKYANYLLTNFKFAIILSLR